MGMSVGAGGGTGGRRRRGMPRYAAMAEINMTPFIDVMLVLLIIFMVAAPLLSTGVPIDLPATKAGELKSDQKPIAVAIDDRGQISVNDKATTIGDLVNTLQSIAKDGVDERIYIRAAKTTQYNVVAEVMSVISAAGYKKLAIVTKQSDK